MRKAKNTAKGGKKKEKMKKNVKRCREKTGRKR